LRADRYAELVEEVEREPVLQPGLGFRERVAEDSCIDETRKVGLGGRERANADLISTPRRNCASPVKFSDVAA
jgi:hypothetical protein